MQHNALMTPGAAWYGDGGNTNLKLGQPQRKGAFSPPRSASKKPNGKMKRPSQQRPPSAPLLSNLGSSKPVLLGSSKPVRPQTASGLPHAASAAQFAAGHALGGPLLQPKRAAKLRMPNSATQAELTRLKRTTSGGALPPRLADDLLEGPVVLGGAGGAEYDRRSGGVRPADPAAAKPCGRRAAPSLLALANPCPHPRPHLTLASTIALPRALTNPLSTGEPRLRAVQHVACQQPATIDRQAAAPRGKPTDAAESVQPAASRAAAASNRRWRRRRGRRLGGRRLSQRRAAARGEARRGAAGAADERPGGRRRRRRRPAAAHAGAAAALPDTVGE
eukprot:scaffold82507_cov72-Phaeocystis_antarctica.AAC.8